MWYAVFLHYVQAKINNEFKYHIFQCDIFCCPLEIYNEEEWYMGCSAVWIMKCSINKSKYRILLNKSRHNSSSRISVTGTRTLTEDEKINKEIEDMNEMIEKKKKDIESFGDFKY